MNYYISDIHFSDSRIMKLCDRPFMNTYEMDEYIIKKWNETISDSDDVYILGDISKDYMPEIYKRLKGNKYLILGNHDYDFKDELASCHIFEEVIDIKTIVDENKKVVLFHYPIMDWEDSQYGSIHLYGHIHNKDLPDIYRYYAGKNAYNVSCDVNDFRPVSLKELIEKRGA